MLLAILAAWLGYKKAKETNRNTIVWPIVAVAVFIGTQLAVGIGAGTIIGIGIAAGSWAENTFERFEILINLIAIMASIGVTLGLLHFIREPRPADDYYAPPPPPNDFGQNS